MWCATIGIDEEYPRLEVSPDEGDEEDALNGDKESISFAELLLVGMRQSPLFGGEDQAHRKVLKGKEEHKALKHKEGTDGIHSFDMVP